MRLLAFSPKLLMLSVSMSLLLGCSTLSNPSVGSQAPYQAKQGDWSKDLVSRAMDSYLSDAFPFWEILRKPTATPSTTKVSIDITPQNIDSNLKAKALAGTLQDTLEVERKVAINIAPLIEKSADDHKVPSSLIAALVQIESEFKSNKRSQFGAVGLTQVMPKVWGKQCNLRTDAGNIDCGAKILAHYYDLSGDWQKALAYYNVGPGRYGKSSVARKVGHRYAKNVMASMQEIKKGREQMLLASARGM